MPHWSKSLVLPVLALTVGCGAETARNASASLNADSVERIESALSNGSYTLSTKRDGNKCLDVAHGDNRDGALVQIATCNGGAAQAWTKQGGQLRIFGDKCLNVTHGDDRNGTRLQIWTCNDGDGNGKWTVMGEQLQWKNHNRCLDLSGGQTGDGTPMQIWDCDGNNDNQKWAFRPTGGVSGQGGAQAPVIAPNNNSVSAGATPDGLDVAPYFWTWARWGQYPIRSLADGRQKANMQSATIAFALSGGGCNISNDITDMGDEIRSYIQGGGRVILSFGGAAGTYVEDTCNDSGQLANALDNQMKTLNTRALDFDIEGQHLNTMDRTNILLDALKILQGRYSDLYVSFTLPVDDNAGIPNGALNVIRGAANKGVRVSRVNIMTMDFGHGPRAGQDFGDQCTNAATATFNQLKNIYPAMNDRAVWRMVGITPMIGENDDHYKMTTADARKLARFAKDRGVGMLSFWGMQRDRSGYGSLNDFTNVPQQDFEFLSIFNSAR